MNWDIDRMGYCLVKISHVYKHFGNSAWGYCKLCQNQILGNKLKCMVIAVGCYLIYHRLFNPNGFIKNHMYYKIEF